MVILYSIFGMKGKAILYPIEIRACMIIIRSMY